MIEILYLSPAVWIGNCGAAVEDEKETVNVGRQPMKKWVRSNVEVVSKSQRR
jgi:hypothetical protein